MSTFKTVAELVPYKEICHIYVQIIRLWKNYIAADRYTIELVLCDAFGDKIHASISSSLVAPYEPRLKQGLWTIFEKISVIQSGGAYRTSKHASISSSLVAPYEPRLKQGLWTIFEKNSVIQSGGAYRTSKHAYLIEFVCNTRVCVCDFLPRALTGFQPVAFRDILDGLVNTEYLVGAYTKTYVIDQIVGVSHLEIVSVNGKDTEKITLELQNQLSDRLTVHLLGKYAIFVHDATQNLIQKKCIICVIRFAKIGVFKEVEAFLKLVNKRDPHIALVASKPYCPIPELYGNFRFFKPIIQKSIIEVLETKQQQRYIVMCTIAAIDYDMGWYNLQLVVLDNTGHSKFLLLDNLAEELLGIPCVALYGSSSDQIEDPVVVHSVLSKLVGGTYFCKIVIEEQNFMFNCQTFKVLEIIPTYEF
ncbi:hypothetical protein IGI04_002413 [Brassica rapa subsp. trilocularis]|uniref:Replication protein A 70 kDa DNA-binding subunit B/D first OB fold domain-containing protein n=1 Tax=Brassica rapa subsp. trilocularis TaxID=1813537 RepID=A0ABQ7NXM1_BRACM|nr:hypothetical protein IGI04_002413 [Brassica rapa subsp. trilocularis]